ncbi:MAG: hypothetical protein B9S33_19810 [Pedosphaera sp. Tous-C6FEB]|nr:MAG: hypothetical protein B9S33_19810 [Pedosphaera sp. Tous-C6FEB]
MSQPSPYRKLPGRGTRREGNFFITVMARQSALWLGADHLLLVDSTIASQDLKRFYFRDIQAITVRKTHTGRTLNIVMAVLAAIACGLTLGVDDSAGRIALFVIAGVFGTILLVNFLFGPTCETHLQTAVQRDQLPSLGRLRNAQKVLRTLRPLIEQAQGQITAEEARARAATLTATPVAPARVKPVPQLRPLRTSFHTALFALLLVDGLLNGAALFLNSMPLALLQLAGLFGIVLTLVGALIRQQDTDIPVGLRRLGRVLIGYLCVLLAAGFVVGIVHSIQNPSVQNELAAMRHFSSLDPFDHPWLLGWFAATSLCSSILGLTGLTLLSRYRREQSVTATATPVATVPPRLPAAPPTLPVPAVELAPPLPPPVAPPPPPPHG